MIIYAATLGQRPEAITIALDLLRECYAFDRVVILHTEPQLSGIATALEDLRAVLAADYADLPIAYQQLMYPDGGPLLDIANQAAATAYYHAIYAELLAFKQERATVHLMVAGGRKAMSIYAVLAAGLIFDPHDRVWTVLSSKALLERPGTYHVPPHLAEQAQVVQLPVPPARLLHGSVPRQLLEHPEAMLAQRCDRRAAFLNRLSLQEHALAETLMQHPYDSTQRLADRMHKSRRTLDAQFQSIYNKMVSFLDFGDAITNKRQALLDILLDRS